MYLKEPYRTTASGRPDRAENPYPLGCRVISGQRYLHTELGRWVNRDPIGNAGGKAIYCFVDNNAVDAADLLGLSAADQKPFCCNRLFDSVALSQREVPDVEIPEAGGVRPVRYASFLKFSGTTKDGPNADCNPDPKRCCRIAAWLGLYSNMSSFRKIPREVEGSIVEIKTGATSIRINPDRFVDFEEEPPYSHAPGSTWKPSSRGHVASFNLNEGDFTFDLRMRWHHQTVPQFFVSSIREGIGVSI